MVEVEARESLYAEKLSWEEYISRGQEAREMGDQSSWILGDLSIGISTDYGEDSIGKYAYAVGLAKKTVMGYRTVASKFNKDIRDKYRKLSFSHFKTVASLEKPEAWLEKADNEEWPVEKLSIEIKEAYGDMRDEIDDKPPRVIRCKECGLWRLEGLSMYDICKGHYTLEGGKLEYK